MSTLQTVRQAMLCAAAVLLASASIAKAQAQIEVTPFAGYYIASDIYNTYSTVNPGTSTVELTNSGLWGVKVAAVGFRGGLEFSYTRTGSDIKINHPLQGQPPRGTIGRLELDSYDINFIGYQPTGNPRAVPYGIVGFGWTVTHPDVDSDFLDVGGPQPDSNTLFNFNFGLGFKLAMNERLSTRIEGRWRVTDTHLTTDAGYWCDPYGYCYSYATDWYNSGELLAGFSFVLGGRH